MGVMVEKTITHQCVDNVNNVAVQYIGNSLQIFIPQGVDFLFAGFFFCFTTVILKLLSMSKATVSLKSKRFMICMNSEKYIDMVMQL